MRANRSDANGIRDTRGENEVAEVVPEGGVDFRHCKSGPEDDPVEGKLLAGVEPVSLLVHDYRIPADGGRRFAFRSRTGKYRRGGQHVLGAVMVPMALLWVWRTAGVRKRFAATRVAAQRLRPLTETARHLRSGGRVRAPRPIPVLKPRRVLGWSPIRPWLVEHYLDEHRDQ